jgi:hypothetical protein
MLGTNDSNFSSHAADRISVFVDVVVRGIPQHQLKGRMKGTIRGLRALFLYLSYGLMYWKIMEMEGSSGGSEWC